MERNLMRPRQIDFKKQNKFKIRENFLLILQIKKSKHLEKVHFKIKKKILTKLI